MKTTINRTILTEYTFEEIFKSPGFYVIAGENPEHNLILIPEYLHGDPKCFIRFFLKSNSPPQLIFAKDAPSWGNVNSYNKLTGTEIKFET